MTEIRENPSTPAAAPPLTADVPASNPLPETMPGSSPDALPEALDRDVRAAFSVPVAQRVLDTVCRLTGMGFATIARVTEAHWVACRVRDDIGFGLGVGGELPVRTTLCHEVRGARHEIVIDDVEHDPRYVDHPCPARYGFRSYVSVPILLADGTFFGTLCAIDPRPADLRESGAIDTFRLFADLIATQLDTALRLARSESELADARSVATLREEFVAVIGHDLRNPLASIDANAQLIGALAEDGKLLDATHAIERSVRRMSELIGDLLDLARGRLGGGIALEVGNSETLVERLLQVVDELRRVHPEREIEVRMDIGRHFDCDPGRLAQMLSNLLGNAVVHGSADIPIVVEAKIAADRFHLAVTNGGEPIPDTLRGQLFQPFRRAEDGRVQGGALGGLGLGLYIAHEIGRAHGGTIELDSNEDGTRFTFTMPIAPADSQATLHP